MEKPLALNLAEVSCTGRKVLLPFESKARKPIDHLWWSAERSPRAVSS